MQKYITWNEINYTAKRFSWSVLDKGNVKTYRRQNIYVKVTKVYSGYKILIYKNNNIINNEVLNNENLTKLLLWEYLTVVKY